MDNQFNITRNELNTLTRVMVKRISKGYTAEELSFLIGFTADYIPDVEMLKEPIYDGDVLSLIMEALEDENFKTFYGTSYQEDIVQVEMMKLPTDDGQVTQCRIINDQGYGIMHFTLQEELNKHSKTDALYQSTFMLALDALKLLLAADYFQKERTTLEIFQRINTFFSAGTIRPCYIKEALDALSLTKETAALEEIVFNDRMGYYIAL